MYLREVSRRGRNTPPAFVLTRCPCVCIHTTRPPTQGPRMSMHPEMRERVYGNDASSHHHKLWAVPTQRRRSASSSVSGAGTWYPARENHPLDLVASTDLQPASTHSAAALAPVYFESSFCIQMFLIWLNRNSICPPVVQGQSVVQGQTALNTISEILRLV